MLRHVWALLRTLLNAPTPLERNLLYVPQDTPVRASLHHWQVPTSRSTTTPYALITGSTDGVGEALAIELASQYGFNIVLHGRSQDKLDAVRNRVITASMHSAKGYKQGPVSVITICADASKAGSIDWAEFVRPLEDINLSVLVNNVGVSTASLKGNAEFRSFDSFPAREVEDVMSINVTFPTLVTKAVLPYLQRSPTRRSLVAGISSAAAVWSLPYLTIYSAGKAAFTQLLQSLRLELLVSHRLKPHTTPVDVQNFVVGAVRTRRLAKETTSTPDNPDVEEFARSLARVLGDGYSNGAAHPVHALQVFVMSWLPSFVRDLMLQHVGYGFFKKEFGKLRYA